MMPLVRTRLSLGVVSLAVIGLELSLMRALSLRFWSHLAYMVISVSLLGFGASGTAINLLRRWIRRRSRAWLCGLALAFSASIPLAWWASQLVPLDVGFLAWSLSQVGNVLALELLMFVPFLLAGAFVGVALMDSSERISGHYAANLIGSGCGGIGAVVAMYALSTSQLIMALTIATGLAGALLLPWRRPGPALAGAAVLAATVLSMAAMPYEPSVSAYKMLAQAQSWPGTQRIHHSEGPLGRIDVLAGPTIHYAPGLSLEYMDPLPPHVLLIIDGDQSGAVYDCKHTEDWAFLDHTTAAAAYHLRKDARVCIVGAGGGADLGLALYHHNPQIVALEMNPQVVQAMIGPLAWRGGAIYRADGVHVINQEARGYFASTAQVFEIIQVPATDAFGASGAGLYATQESYLYTVESIEAMFDHLAADGLLSITRWARTPPRDELRAFDMAAQALRRRNLDPSAHLAMLRSWATVTVLVSRRPIVADDVEMLRGFCRERSFDLCYLPGMKESEANRYHLLAGPYYYQAARSLLGQDRQRYLDDYPFEIVASTDERPYFFHSFRWRSLPMLAEQLHGSSHAFLEIGYLMLVAAFAQTVILALVLIPLPLVPGIRTMRHTEGKASSLLYFLLLGAGFMLLEMGFLQKLILYLAHPIYSAAAVISSFLIFAGIGSQLSQSWPLSPKGVMTTAAIVIACLSGIYLLTVDGWLSLTQAWPMPARFGVASLTIAPLAVAMGHMFPTGLRQAGGVSEALVPWAWAVNGFASVVATVAAPLLAMSLGFSRVILVASACYVLAGLFARAMPSPASES